jgi:hypothetical protein
VSGLNGRIVEILTFDDAGRSTVALWWAVIDDDAEAVKAVQQTAGTNADQGVRVTGHLYPADIRMHGLAAGQAVPARS